MAEVDELNDLLGDSDEEKETESNVKQESVNELLGVDSDEEIDQLSSKKIKSEIENELGDDSDDDELKEEKLNEADSLEAKNKDLDQILGAGQTSVETQVKSKTNSTLSIPDTYKISEQDTSFFMRTPNFIKIQSEPFDSATHNSETEKTQFGNTTSVVRWRYKRDENGDIVLDSSGIAVKESNAKLIRWDDGTYQLIVGDAVFNSKIVIADSW